MDNLPAATKYVDETNPAHPLTIYDLGFPLGFKGSPMFDRAPIYIQS